MIPFGEGAYIIEFDIGESALNIVGRRFRVREDFVHGLPNVVGVKRDGASFVPNDDSVLQIGDQLPFR